MTFSRADAARDGNLYSIPTVGRNDGSRLFPTWPHLTVRFPLDCHFSSAGIIQSLDASIKPQPHVEQICAYARYFAVCLGYSASECKNLQTQHIHILLKIHKLYLFDCRQLELKDIASLGSPLAQAITDASRLPKP